MNRRHFLYAFGVTMTIMITAPPRLAAQESVVRKNLAAEAVPGLGNYLYDPSGNVTLAGTHVFRYDAFGRLQRSELATLGTQAYLYDRYGNLLKIIRNDNDHRDFTVRMSVDPETNQIDLPYNATTNDANRIGVYDAAGNLIQHQGHTYAYDALNMMKETTDTSRRLHVYSASDERVMVVQAANDVETSSEWTLRDGSARVLRRLTRSGAGAWEWKEDYVYGGARLLAAEVPTAERVRHFHVDPLGTPRLITGNGGVRLAEKTYEPFGPRVSAATGDFEQIEFTGHERDLPTLDYMHARYYQPELGRFFSVDPARTSADPELPQSWNRYAYVRNNPVNFMDPDGRDPRIGRFFRSPFGKTLDHLSRAATALRNIPVINPAVRLAGTGGSVKAGPLTATTAADVQVKARSDGSVGIVGNLQATTGRGGTEAGQRLTVTGTIYPQPDLTAQGGAITQTGDVTGKLSTNFQVTATVAAGNFRLEAGVDLSEAATFAGELRAAAGAAVDEAQSAIAREIEERLEGFATLISPP